MSRHIALVEDDEIISANYADFLTGLGYRVDQYPTKDAALDGLRASPPELVLLDVSLNGERDAGFWVCAEIRSRTPLQLVIFLSSHDTEVDRISGLRLGADDYISKDLSLDFLIVRIEALFRRRDAYAASRLTSRAADPKPPLVQLPRLQFDLQRSAVTWRAAPVELTLTQFWILHDLHEHEGQPRTPADLMRAAKLTVEPNTIAAHIKAIRDAFLRIDSSFERIRTERGRGYRWMPD